MSRKDLAKQNRGHATLSAAKKTRGKGGALPQKADKDELSARIAETVAEFEAAGGKVEVIENEWPDGKPYIRYPASGKWNGMVEDD